MRVCQTAGTVIVGATSSQSITVASNEVSPGIVGGAGGAEPTAKLLGTLSAYVASGASIGAGSLSVTAQSTDTAETDAQAFGTGIVTGAGADAECDVDVDTEAYVGAAAVTLSGSANIDAAATETARANCGKLPQTLLQRIFGTGGGFGVLAYGSALANASVEGDVKAHIDGETINASGGVGVSAADTDQTTATTYCMVFGLLFSSLSNHANATLTPAVDAWINGAQIQAGGNVAVTADAETTAAASVVGRSIGILSAGPSASNATDSPLVNSYIGASSSIVAAGTINVQGMHNTGAGIGATARRRFALLWRCRRKRGHAPGHARRGGRRLCKPRRGPASRRQHYLDRGFQ